MLALGGVGNIAKGLAALRDVGCTDVREVGYIFRATGFTGGVGEFTGLCSTARPSFAVTAVLARLDKKSRCRHSPSNR